MLELHYPTPTKTILKRQYPGKPTLKAAFGNIWQRRHFRKLLEVARFLFSWRHDGQDHRDKRTPKFTTVKFRLVGTLSRVIKVYQEMYQNSHVYPCIAMYTYV